MFVPPIQYKKLKGSEKQRLRADKAKLQFNPGKSTVLFCSKNAAQAILKFRIDTDYIHCERWHRYLKVIVDENFN